MKTSEVLYNNWCGSTSETNCLHLALGQSHNCLGRKTFQTDIDMLTRIMAKIYFCTHSHSSQRYRQILFYTALVFTLLTISSVRRGIGDTSDQNQRPTNDMKETESKVKSEENIEEGLVINWDATGPKHKPWAKDLDCSRFVTRFAKHHSLVTRALVSYPGSGNTWIR